jgi:hypothetical protein
VTAGVLGVVAPTRLGLVDQLLRAPDALSERIERGEDLPGLARTMIGTIAVSAALVGAAIGTYRGGVQIAFAAIKLPIVLLTTAVLCVPTLTALQLARGRTVSPTRDLARILSALAFGALILLAQAPLLLLAKAISLDYHRTALLFFWCFASSGAAAVRTLARGVRRGGTAGAGAVLATTVVVFALVGAQVSWTFRPYLVRPRSQEVPFVRDLEGSLFDAVVRSMRSARGVYDEEGER